MFEREHHLRIASVLEALDPAVLERHLCWFGGGTSLALLEGEFRESRDLDFLVSDLPAYRELRQLLTGAGTLAPLTRAGATLTLARELRADQYGVRTMLRVAGVELKLEIVFERRVALERPGPDDRICGVATLTRLDRVTTELLANSDRWADDAASSRDLIDLAMLKPTAAVLRAAMAKAKGAYGESVERDLAKAIQRLRERPGRLEACMRELRIDAIPRAVVWGRIKKLAPLRGRPR